MSSRKASTIGRLALRRHVQPQQQRLHNNPLVTTAILDPQHYDGYHHQHSNHFNNNANYNGRMDLHTYALNHQDHRRDDERAPRNALMLTSAACARADFHTSAPSERAVAIMLGLTSLSAASYAAATAVQSYREWKASQPSEEEVEEERKQQAAAQDESQKNQEQAQQQQKTTSQGTKGPRENMFKEWFGVGVGAKYYEGGFEESMTRREAALILGVRESSTARRIKEAHRKLLVLNHPDTGGSTYMSLKINEAKEMLLKGKSKL
jgi:DnaJ family protein C protein 19